MLVLNFINLKGTILLEVHQFVVMVGVELIKNASFHVKHPFDSMLQKTKKKRCLVAQATPSRTQRIMESISNSGEVGGAGGANSYNALKRLDHLWSTICNAKSVVEEPKQVVSAFPGLTTDSALAADSVDVFDVVICGGTLGIFLAAALTSKGLRVAVVERNILKGREQEWNISRKELLDLVEVGILTYEDIEQATVTNFNPNRCGFEGKGEIWVEDILNLGVSPAKLIDIIKDHFASLGGVILEGYSVSSIQIYDDAAVLQLVEGKVLSSRLIIRFGRKPDGVCLVVGSCSKGYEKNSTSDVIYSSASVKKVGKSEAQYFWEAFPAGSGAMDRTTYMFTYVDPQPGCPRLEELLEDYWDLMPHYQGVPFDNLEILRVVFGIFPTYRDSPLPAAFDRVLQFGDASGIQSPVSFGGFGSLTRHLGRITEGLYEAIDGDFLDARDLSLLNSYMKLGDPVLRPFLQDVIQFGPLVKTLGLVMLTKPEIIPSIFKQVGVVVLVEWSGHFAMLGYYTFLSTFLEPIIRPLISSLPAHVAFKWKRRVEAWKYGAGLDYKLTYSKTEGREVDSLKRKN
ncbi:hypothetical protein Leryth_026628 [Lithospermum erythrorhizon]|nr:hypothetical protein Leryth_026628 [Lithospermum erythrorhizon]